MNTTMKRNVVVSAVLVIALCVSLIAGATFALFTSESRVDVSVKSGTVDVTATASEPQLSSTLSEGNLTETSVSSNGNTVTLDNIVAGDVVKFTITIHNASDVSVKYRTVITKVTDDGLWDGLVVKFDEVEFKGDSAKKSEWTLIAPESKDVTVEVEVSLPESATSEYAGKSCSFAYTVEAVQGNADVVSEWNGNSDTEGFNANTDEETKTIEINTAAQLKAFAESVSINNTYYGYTVKLNASIDLAGEMWPGIGSSTYSDFPSYFFNGTFDGQGHTIKNMTVSNLVGNVSTAGFFNGLGRNAIVKGLNFENASVTSNHEAGVVVGYCQTAAGNGVDTTTTALIEDCHVDGATVISKAHQLANGTYDDGDKAGGIAGLMFFDIKDCSVKNSTIIGVRDLGGIAGIAYGTVSGCSVENVDIIRDVSKIDNDSNVDSIVGRKESFCNIEDCTGEANISVANVVADGVMLVNGVYEISNANGLKYCRETFCDGDKTSGKSFALTADIDLDGIEWDTWVPDAQQYFNAIFDGRGHTISNMTINNDRTKEGSATGFVGRLGSNGANASACVKNVIFDNANVTGHHNVGVAVGYNEFGSVQDVTVKNSKVTATCAVTTTNDDPCGDKAGAIIGFIGTSCTGANNNLHAENCTVTAARDAAQVIGFGYADNSITNVTATNVTVSGVAGDCTHTRAGQVSANALVGNGTQAGLTLN